jgi:hypothetical protein
MWNLYSVILQLLDYCTTNQFYTKVNNVDLETRQFILFPLFFFVFFCLLKSRVNLFYYWKCPCIYSKKDVLIAGKFIIFNTMLSGSSYLKRVSKSVWKYILNWIKYTEAWVNDVQYAYFNAYFHSCFWLDKLNCCHVFEWQVIGFHGYSI